MSHEHGEVDLEAQRGWLTGWIARAASPALLRLESAEDLVQGVFVEAERGAESARWTSAEVLRAGNDGVDGRLSPLDTATGPSTFAARREQVELLARALAVLLPIDRDLLVLSSEGQALAEVARRTGLSYENAQRRRLRAVARLKRAFEILAGGEQ